MIYNMNRYESSLLAGIPNAPSAYALSEHRDLAEQRQRQVMENMELDYYSLYKKQNDIRLIKKYKVLKSV